MSTNSFGTHTDITELCRVCLQLPEESQYLDLTTIYDEEENLTYGECFTICTQIDLSDGIDVPHHLCKSCGLELQMCYDFYQKIEESKRVIEQYQKQKKVQELNAIELQSCSEQSKNQNLNVNEKIPMVQIIDDDFINDEQLPETSEETKECYVLQQENEKVFTEPSNANNETDEMDIIDNICHNEVDTHQVQLHKNELNIVTANEEDEVKIEIEHHLEMEDYQNLETLDDEEAETLQINCVENTVKKIKILTKRGECEEFVEYAVNYNEREESEDLGDEYTAETNEEDEYIEDPLTWQENVVAVANKEHLPIIIENSHKEEGNRKRHITKTAKCQTNESLIIKNDSSQDDYEANVIEYEDKLNEKEAGKNKSRPTENKNSTGRKRHVGSYSCDYCHRVYPNYSRMKTHRRCHEIDRPKFSCSHCGRMYATKQARDCHVQTAHDKSGYTCSICNKVFAIRKSLEIHVRYHTGDFPYACDLCERKFAQACHLNTHINVQHKQIRFSCEYPNCGKYFTSSTSLRNHEYTHSVMPFECEYCHQGYPAKSKLRVHIQRKHSIDTSNEQLENMRKFFVMRSKVNLVQFVDT